jgi:hypothetical protein
MTRALRLAALAAALSLGPAADAQEVIATGPADAAQPSQPASAATARIGDPEQSPQAIGAWARGVLAGRPAAEAAPPDAAAAPGGCVPAAERRSHGEVWVGAGTRGYREAGGVVTAPLGACGQLTIGVDKTEGPDFRRRR